MLINLLGLKTLDIIIMFIGCLRHYMGLSKPRELGMSAFGTSSLRRASPLGRSIPHYSPRLDGHIFICQVYVDDIIFGSPNEDFCKEFGELMSKEFEMSMIGELTFFLGFQVKQMREGIFISQEKYTNDLLKRFKMDECKPIKTPMPTNGHLDLDEGGNTVDQTLYRSMIGSLLYLTASRPRHHV